MVLPLAGADTVEDAISVVVKVVTAPAEIGTLAAAEVELATAPKPKLVPMLARAGPASMFCVEGAFNIDPARKAFGAPVRPTTTPPPTTTSSNTMTASALLERMTGNSDLCRDEGLSERSDKTIYGDQAIFSYLLLD